MNNSNLVRTTIRILPSQVEWLEKKAIVKQRTFAEVLRECIQKFIATPNITSNAQTYASNTVPKAVYLGKNQLDHIETRCKTNGGTMSGIIRQAIDSRMK